MHWAGHSPVFSAKVKYKWTNISSPSVPSWHVEGQLSFSHINDRQQTIVLEMWSLPITRIDAANVKGTGFDMLVYRLQSSN